MGASPLRASRFINPILTGRQTGRAKAKTDPLFGGTMHRPRSHQRLAGPFAHLGTRKQARAKRGTGPHAKPKPR